MERVGLPVPLIGEEAAFEVVDDASSVLGRRRGVGGLDREAEDCRCVSFGVVIRARTIAAADLSAMEIAA